MNEKTDKKSLGPNSRPRWTLVALGVAAFALAVSLTAVPLYLTIARGFDQLVSLGLLQPIVAAFLALAIVLGIRVTAGRYVGERRKGGSSASSATIALRLWALCFSLLTGAMLLFAALARSPEWLRNERADWKPIHMQVEANVVAGSTTANVRVRQ